MTDNNEELVRRARSHDAGAFFQLAATYERVLLAIGYAVTGDADRAGEVAQEALLRGWEAIGKLSQPARFGPWLCQIARRVAVDIQRRGPVEPRRLALERPAPDPGEQAEDAELLALLQAAVAELDETSRMIVMLRYYDDLSAKEVAQLLEMTPAAVDMRLSRARQTLKETLSQRVR